jgi:hypothetical protein
VAIEMHYRSVRFDEPAEDGVKDFTIVKLPPDAGSLAIEMHYRSVASLQRSLRFDPDEDLRVATGVIYLHTQPLANPLTPEEIANLNRLLVGTPLPYFRNHRVLGLFQRKLDGIPRGGWTFAYGPYSPDSGDKGEYGSVNCWEFMVCARPNLNPIRAKLDPPPTTQSGMPQDPNALCYALRDITCYLCGEKIGIVKEIDQLTCVIACWKRDRPEWYFVKCSNHRLLRALPDIARDAVHTPGWNLSGGAAYTHRSYR